jgi:hypothetical protein
VKISFEKLASESAATGFRPEVIEKVAQLLNLLDSIRSRPFLRGKLVLKGDIDLNYVGAEGRETMLAERPKIEQAVQAVSRQKLTSTVNRLNTLRQLWVIPFQPVLYVVLQLSSSRQKILSLLLRNYPGGVVFTDVSFPATTIEIILYRYEFGSQN